MTHLFFLALFLRAGHSAKDWAAEMFKDRNLETSLGPWDEESVYSTEESGKESRS